MQTSLLICHIKWKFYYLNCHFIFILNLKCSCCSVLLEMCCNFFCSTSSLKLHESLNSEVCGTEQQRPSVKKLQSLYVCVCISLSIYEQINKGKCIFSDVIHYFLLRENISKAALDFNLISGKWQKQVSGDVKRKEQNYFFNFPLKSSLLQFCFALKIEFNCFVWANTQKKKKKKRERKEK